MMMLEHSALDFYIIQGQGQLYDDDDLWRLWFMMLMIYVLIDVYMIVLGMPDVRQPTVKYFVESFQPNKS